MSETYWEVISGENTGTITTNQTKWLNKIKKFKEQYPDKVDIKAVNKDGSMVAWLPSDWFKLSPPRQGTLNEEQRQAAAERLRLAREARSGKI